MGASMPSSSLRAATGVPVLSIACIRSATTTLNIAYQIELHENFEFKAVDLDRERVVRKAVSVERVIMPAEVVRQ